MIVYQDSAGDLKEHQVQGFFVGWPNPPSAATFLRLLERSDRVMVAIDDRTGQLVGFVTAHTDHVLSAYLPLLEVLPAWQHRGIGSELVRRMLKSLEGLYMVDLACDPALEPFYASLGFRPGLRMGLRRYEFQSGREE